MSKKQNNMKQNIQEETISIEIKVPVQYKEEILSAIQSLEASPDCVKDFVRYPKARLTQLRILLGLNHDRPHTDAENQIVKDLLKYAKAKQDDRLENALNAEIAHMNDQPLPKGTILYEFGILDNE